MKFFNNLYLESSNFLLERERETAPPSRTRAR